MKVRIVLALFTLLMAGVIAGAAPDQPFMRAARADLQTAKNQLQQAARDKSGHRAKALSLVNQAIAQVNQGIAYDHRHNHASALKLETLFAATPDQPHMQAALDALESAKNNLERASADKGGHRANALGLVKDAISEVKKGIEAAR
jgi:membrane protease subunit (stomatin/prohibitin family)